MAASKPNGDANGTSQQPARAEADFAQAFKELAQGERQASQMEGQLDALERKLDELLADAERQYPQQSSGQASDADSTNSTSTIADKTRQP